MAACAVAVALMGATCWRWHGSGTQTLPLDQAVTALEQGRDSTHAITMRWKETLRALREAAQRDGDRGRHARHALESLKREINR